jgi:hypothetical protein
MGIDLERFRVAREEAEAKHKDKEYGDRGPGFWKADEPAFHAIFIAPPSEDMDLFPFLGGMDGVFVHYKVGASNRMCLCLADDNVALWSEAMQSALDWTNEARRERGKPEWAVDSLDPSEGCPVCQEILDSETTYDELKLEDMGRKQLWLHNVIPWWVMSLTGGKRREIESKLLRPWWASYKQWRGVCDLISLNGDITDPMQGVLTIVKRTGKEFKDTRYELAADGDTLRTPLVIPKPLRALVAKTTMPGGENNLYMVAAGLVRSADAVRDLLRGSNTTSKTVATGEPGVPVCFQADCDPEDIDCRRCPYKGDCAEACGVEVPPDVEGEEAVVPVTAKPAARPVPRPPRAAESRAVIEKPASSAKPAPAPVPRPKPVARPASAQPSAASEPVPRPSSAASAWLVGRGSRAASPRPPPPDPEPEEELEEVAGGPAPFVDEDEDADLEAFTRDLDEAAAAVRKK